MNKLHTIKLLEQTINSMKKTSAILAKIASDVEAHRQKRKVA